MKNLLSVLLRRIALSLAVVTLMVAVHLWSIGEFYLVGALFLGYFLSAVFVASTALRLRKAIGLGKSQAKRQMLFGLALRLLMLFTVLWAAVHISEKIFGATATGFLVGYVVIFLNLIILNFTDKS